MVEQRNNSPSEKPNTDGGVTESKGLSTTPLIYIGKNLEKPIWYFVSLKDGFCRFLHFGFPPLYPFWMAGVNTGKGAPYSVPDKMSPSSCPKEVWDEVQLFVDGKSKYEFIPSRKGRKAEVIRTVSEDGALATDRKLLRPDVQPTKKAQGREQDQTCVSRSGSKAGRPSSVNGLRTVSPQSERKRDSSVVNPGGGTELPGKNDKPNVLKRRKPADIHQLVTSATKGVCSDEDKVTRTAGSAVIPITKQGGEVIPVKKGRGRPRTKPLAVVTADEKIDVKKSKKEQKTTKSVVPA